MRIFLSFAIEDSDFAQMVADALETAGHLVLMDAGGIPGGDNWRLEVGRAIHHSDWFVVIYSISAKDSLKRKLEFIFALANEVPILYVLTEPTEVIEDDISRVLDISINPLSGVKNIVDFFKNPPRLIERVEKGAEPTAEDFV
ncbi:MAG TPA: toll/interleukin-1 receptor domain-containing protein, partial [Phototrophicaceae bacterium]|nr:toll/interleukin-1 receptor domain-containing protein [Phototrophicaceae bacterium]